MLKDFAVKQESFWPILCFEEDFNPEDTIYKSLPILISGPARSFIKFKVQDSTQVKVDSLAVEDEFDL
jgi:hypothetical protein